MSEDLIALAMPIVQAYAKANPKHEWRGTLQDPCGAHAWLESAARLRAVPGKQPEAPAVPVVSNWPRLRNSLAIAMLGFAGRQAPTLDAAEKFLEALADGPLPQLRAALSAPVRAAPSDEQITDAIEREFSETGEWPEGDAATVRAALKHLPKSHAPIDMVLHCPACGMQHIDADEPPGHHPFSVDVGLTWTNRPHRSHLCHGCGHIWRTADVETNGVAAVQTKGKDDFPIAKDRLRAWPLSINYQPLYLFADKHRVSYNELCTAVHEATAKDDFPWTLGKSPVEPLLSFQQRVQPWMMECFGPMISADRKERNHRFIEEALELVQACGCSASEAHQLVDYVFNRPMGEPEQEVGGVMVTLAALCLANHLDMHANGETELARISEPAMVEKIRAKQAAKPKHSPLPTQEQIDNGPHAHLGNVPSDYTQPNRKVDGVELVAGDRVLRVNANQADMNGIYQIQAGTMTIQRWAERLMTIGCNAGVAETKHRDAWLQAVADMRNAVSALPAQPQGSELDRRITFSNDPHLNVLYRTVEQAYEAGRQDAQDTMSWQPISTAPKDGTPIRLYAQGGGFYDEDFNPSGSVEGFWCDDSWIGAFWNNHRDEWSRRDGIVPTHWQPLPEPPEDIQALLRAALDHLSAGKTP